MDGHNVTLPEHPAQALGWLDLLASPMPDTVGFDFEISGYLVFVIARLVALWIWRHPRSDSRSK